MIRCVYAGQLAVWPWPADQVLQDGDVGEHHALQGSTDMPAYPYVNFEPLLPRFGRDITALQHYAFPQLIWTSVGRLDHVFKVEKTKVIILRRKGVKDVLGLDEEVERILRPPVAPHFRNNFVAERKAVRTEISRRSSLQKAPLSTVKLTRNLAPSDSWLSAFTTATASSPSHNDGSGFEINRAASPLHKHQDVSMPRIRAKRHGSCAHRLAGKVFAPQAFSSTPSSPISISDSSQGGRSPELSFETTRHSKHARTSTAQRFAAHSSPAPSSPASRPDSLSPNLSPLPSPTFTSFAPSVPLPLPTYSASSEQPPTLPRAHIRSAPSDPSQRAPATARKTKKAHKRAYWYAGLHCVEVADGFAKMGSREVAGLKKAERFAFAFGSDRPYNERTFLDAERQWRTASPKAREDAVLAGLSPVGLWKAFSKQHPLKNRVGVKMAAADFDELFD